MWRYRRDPLNANRPIGRAYLLCKLSLSPQSRYNALAFNRFGDPLTEPAQFERFVDLVGERTALMISHQLGMARLGGRILVLRGGQIAEDGYHDVLLARGGVYATLFAAQAQWYR